MTSKPKLLLLITEDWYFWSHRRPIAAAAKAAGFEVLIASRFHKHEQLVRDAGFIPVPIRLERNSRNPLRELLAIIDLIRIYRRERPALVHHVTIKPVLYGSWAAKIAGVPAVVNALAGLGHVFVARGMWASLQRKLAILAYLLTFRVTRAHLILQNPEDQDAFIGHNIVAKENITLVRGAGVDLEEFKCQPEPEGPLTVMFAGRLLWSKGLGDLIEAVRILKAKGTECRLVVVGVPDDANPRAIPENVLKQWVVDGVIHWWGRRDDMPDVLAQANLVALPTTYGEGVPKILIEAAAVGRAIVATDVAGCREIVRHKYNGLLVPPNDVLALAGAIETLLLNPQLRAHMGSRGREIVVAEFSQERVVRETIDVYRSVLGRKWPEMSNPKQRSGLSEDLTKR